MAALHNNHQHSRLRDYMGFAGKKTSIEARALPYYEDFILACHATFIILINIFQLFNSYFLCIISYKRFNFFKLFRSVIRYVI